MIDEDARDLAVHELIDALVTKLAQTNNWSRRQVFDRFECFIEAEEEEQEAAAYLKSALAPDPRRKRGKRLVEARA